MKFNPQEFRDHIYSSLKSHYGKKDLKDASSRDIFYSVSSAVMDYITDNWIATREQYEKKPVKQMYYLSAEFLMGRALGNNLMNLCIKEEVKKVLKEEMESAMKLRIPLKVEVSEAENWYEAK